LFIVLAVAVRFMPHPMAFAPVTAALLFFGARAPRRRTWIPLLLLAASDVVLTRMVYSFPVTWDHYVTWAWYASMLWLGSSLRENARPLRLAGAALTGSVSFFLVSNFAVWAVWRDMYPMTFNGLLACYEAGLPFFRRAVEGDLFFTAVMFATPVVLTALSGWLHRSTDDHIAAA
jgi:hypothetical protein